MSARAGDKSRFNRLRKQKIQRRLKAHELKVAAAATKSEESQPQRKAA